MRSAERGALAEAVIASSLDCIIVFDEAGTIEEFNPAAERTFGYSRAYAIGRSVTDLIVPEHLHGRYREILTRRDDDTDPLLKGRRFETEVLCAEGRLIPVELTMTEVASARRLFTASVRTLAERVRRLELEDTSRELEFAVEAAKLGTWTFDPATGSLSYSDYGKRLYGFEPSDTVDAAAVRQRVHPDDWLVLAAPYYRGFPDERVEIEYRVDPGDGEWRWLYALGASTKDADGKHAAHGILLDVTARKRAEAELEQARRNLELALEGGKLGTWTYNTVSHEIWYSDRARQYFGFGADVAIDYQVLKSRIHPEDWPSFVAPYLAGFPEKRVEHEYRLLDPDGSSRWFYALGAAVAGPGGERMVHGVMMDITERRQAEEELARSRDALHQSEKLAALGSLLAGVSHELNNPLAAVLGQTEMLEEDASGTPFAERARKIASAAERCARIVQSFLAMARQQAPKRQRVDINQLISAALEMTDYSLRTAGVSVRITLAGNLPPVEGDRDQLHQVFANLIVNAQQAMVRGERFEKVLRIQTAVSQSGSVLVDFIDSGPGIPAELRNRIFDPFFTTKPQGEGTGIGLAFSRGIVEAHGGSLSLQPSRHGAHFRVELAALPASLAADQPLDGPAVASPQAVGRVLIVEDEKDVAETLAELLTREGFAVTAVGDGAAALATLQSDDYDMIISDLRMPGMSGRELYQRLSESRPHLVERLGFVTGDMLGSDIAEFLRRIDRPVLEKPFTRTGVHYLIARLSRSGAHP